MVAVDPSQDVSRILTLAEFEPLAAEVMDATAFDYVTGASWDEQTMADNVEAWRRRHLRPRVLVDVSEIQTATTMLGTPVAMPVAVAPMAVHGLAHQDGEVASALAAASAGIPFILSTMSSRSIEEVASAVPDGLLWFQLYAQADPGRSRSLIERAAAAGYRAVILTVDVPTLGYRERDRRSGFDLTVPLGNFADGGPTHAHHRDEVGLSDEVGEDWLSRSLTWADLAAIRGWSDLPLVLKGIVTAEDSRLAVEHGADAIVVSNHGGRQLDRTPATADVLEECVDAVAGQTEVWVDGGIRRGLDVATALALGARGILLGRPVIWSLAVGGQRGVERALAILRDELEIALTLLGAPTPGDLRRAHVAD